MFIDRARVTPDARDSLPAWVCEVPALGPVVDGDGIEFSAPVTFLVGENGSGKSTLVEAIAEQFGLDGRGGRAAIAGGNRDTPKTPLGEALTLDLTFEGRRLRRAPRTARHGFFLRAETVLEMNDRFKHTRGYWGGDVETQSHGEGFFSIIDAMLAAPGVYILDEPESALSFTSCLGLVGRLAALANAGSQVICATHSPILAALPGAQIVELTDEGPVDVPWAELELVGHWRRFLDRPQAYLTEVAAAVRPRPAQAAPDPEANRDIAARVWDRLLRDD